MKCPDCKKGELLRLDKTIKKGIIFRTEKSVTMYHCSKCGYGINWKEYNEL